MRLTCLLFLDDKGSTLKADRAGLPAFCLAGLLGFTWLLGAGIARANPVASGTPRPPAIVAHESPEKKEAVWLSTPLTFVRNAGQDRSTAQFVGQGAGYGVKLFRDAIEVDLQRSCSGSKTGSGTCEPASLRLELTGANGNATLETADRLPGTASYFISSDPRKWRTGLTTFGRLDYRDIYPGIDVGFYGNKGRFEYDFSIAPHADLRKVSIALKRADQATLDRNGDLLLTVDGTQFRCLKPVAWQGSRHTPVEVSYRLQAGKNGGPAVLSFEAGKYDPARTLVIDPVLDFAAYLPLYSETAMTVDAAGNVYVTGQDPANPDEAFKVLKISSTGALLYTDVIQSDKTSGAGVGYSSSIAVDSGGHAFIAGFAGPGWPTTATAYQATNGYAGNPDPYHDYNAYLVKLNNAGDGVAYATYLGGTSVDDYPGTDYTTALALDSAGNAYLTGESYSPNFPTTPGAFETAFPPSDASIAPSIAFVAKIDPNASGVQSLVYSTLLGDQGTSTSGIAVDASGNAYLALYATNQYSVLLAATPGAFAYNGVSSEGGAGAYVIKLNPTGSALVYSAYLGYGNAAAVAVDGSGDAYVAGNVSTEDFPVTNGAYQTSYPGGFAAELNPSGSAEIYSTFLGGPSGAAQYAGADGFTDPQTIAIARGCVSACAAYIVGIANATDFPLVNPIQTTPSAAEGFNSGNSSGFLVALDGTGTAATISSYTGGISSQTIYPSPYLAYLSGTPSIAVDSAGGIYYSANISQPDFPVTLPGTPQQAYYPYLAKFNPAAGALVSAVPGTLNLGETIVNTSSAIYNPTPPTLTLLNVGSAPATITSITSSSGIFSQKNTCNGVLAAGGRCTVTPAFTPTASGPVDGKLSIVATGNGGPLTIGLTGTGLNGGYLETTTAALNFGFQAVGTISASQTVVVKNAGNQPVTGLAFQYLPAAFTTLNNCPASLAAGASCEYELQFAPYEAGYVTGQDDGNIYLAGSQPGGLYIALSGTGVLRGDAGSLSVSPSALNFNPLAVGTSQTQYLTVSNTSAVPVTVTSYTVALTGDAGNALDFAVGPYEYGVGCRAPGVMQPQSSCSVTVTFAPSVVNQETATLSIPNSTFLPLQVALAGTGAADTQKLVFNPTNFVFPDEAVGATSSGQFFFVTNSGDYPVAIDRVFTTGNFTLQSQGCTGTLFPPPQPGQPGEGCYVVAAMSPKVLGNQTGTITFVDSAGGRQTLSLSGNGIAATGTLVVQQPALTFPPQAIGTTSVGQSFTLINPGNSPVTLNSIAISGDYTFSIENTPDCSYALPCVIPPQGPDYYDNYSGSVSFSPTSAANPRSGTMTFNSSAGTQTIALSGIGEAATVAVGLSPAAGSTLNFGGAEVGKMSGSVLVYLHNMGTAEVTLSPPAITGNFVENYSLGDNPCGYVVTLQPGAECETAIQFSPASAGPLTGVLTFNDSAGVQVVSLSGTGTAVAPTTYFSEPTATFPETPVGISTLLYGNYYGNSYTESFSYTGTGSLTIASAQVTAGSASYIIPIYQDGCSGSAILSGSSCSFGLGFVPSSAGYLTGTVTLTDTNGGIYTLPLAGYAPDIQDSGYLSPHALVFGTQAADTISAVEEIILTNSGTTQMTVGAVGGLNVGTTSEFRILQDSCSGVMLSIGGNCVMGVGFTPLTAASHAGQVTIPVAYADGTSHTFAANISGIGEADQNKSQVAPVSLQFPATAIGTTNPDYVYQESAITLYNQGTVPFVVGQVTGTDTIVGTALSGDYVASDSCSEQSVAANSSCSVNIAFGPLPGALGTRRGSLSFPVLYPHATTVTTLTATYSGTAVADVRSLTFAPASVQLGTWTVGRPSADATVTVTNTGNVPASLGTPTIAAPFAVSYDGCGAMLPVGGTCDIAVDFRPAVGGTVNGMLSIPNGSATNPLRVAVSGSGISPSQELIFSQSTIAYGNQLMGTTSASVPLALYNRGTSSVSIKSISLAGSGSADFTVVSDGCTGATVTNQQSCKIMLAFSPNGAASYTATISETDTGTGGPRSVSLTGTGINPTPTAAIFPATLTYQSQNIGTRSTSQSFSVTNTGSGMLKIAKVASTGSGEFTVTADTCYGASLAPRTDCLVSADFVPVTGGTHSGVIAITDDTNNVANSTQSATLTGLVPQAAVTPASLTFSSQNVGTSSAAQVSMLSNAGTGFLTISGIAIGGADAGDFSASNTCSTGLSAGTKCALTVTFTPAAGGTRTATIIITDNSGLAAGSTQTIALTGTGAAAVASSRR